MEDLHRLKYNDRHYLLLGTAHVSQNSVAGVEDAIQNESPDHVCIEIDASRYESMIQGQNWERLNIYQVLKQKKGFLLLAAWLSLAARTERTRYSLLFLRPRDPSYPPSRVEKERVVG